ncbi:MAG: hypothetical protein LBR62_01360 [Puniceicoccales bacterium]|jgi:hypothetical protein|nr:hypothetical protein [Puniceicoccales bacterium]
MKAVRRTLLWLTGMSFVVLLTGCQHENAAALKDSRLPWAKPASWETHLPLGPGIQY